MPTVAINDFEVALPDDPGAVRTDAIDLTLDRDRAAADIPRATCAGRARPTTIRAALLRGEPGRPVELAMDLVWTTAGTPYQYRITPRYEIPCTVSGTVTADGRTFACATSPVSATIRGVCATGGRMDWVWSALHLDDGTHLHGVDIRIPGAPPIGVGYLQHTGPAADRTAGRHRAGNVRRQRLTAGDSDSISAT